MSSRLSRRSLLKASAGLIGASALTGRLVSPAFAGPVDKSAVVLVFLDGGYNALFSSADSFLGNNTFGVTSSNIINAGSGLFVDSSTFGTLAPDVLAHTAAIGINHGQSGHDTATGILWGGTRGRAQVLAGAIGGSAAIKCAVMGGDLPPGSQDAVAGVSMQQILDTGTTLSALGANSDPTLPDRGAACQMRNNRRSVSSPLT